MSVARAGSGLLLALAGAAFIPSCGLAPHDSETPEITGDGISGYREVGPVEFCIGRTAIAPPSEASSEIAVCVDSSRGPVDCDGDAECAFPERCVCGRCVVKGCASDGLGCEANEVCRQGRCTIQCNDDSDCAEGLVCDAGGCAAPCETNADCRYGERCDRLTSPRACRTRLCDSTMPCPSGLECESLQRIGELHEPYLIDFGGSEIAYVELRAAAARSIFRARQTSELEWVADPADPVLEASVPEDLSQVGSPALVVDGGELTMFFVSAAGAAIHRATSSDGIAFTRDPAAVLTADATSWEAGRIESPSVVDHRGARYLIYEGGVGRGIGVARLAEGIATRLDPSSPAFEANDVVDAVFWRALSKVASPHALVVDDVVRIYFAGRGAEGSDAIAANQSIPADVNDSIGLVTTRDFSSFERFPVGPVFARRTNIRAYLGEREPFVRIEDDRARLHFVSTDASGSRVSGVSVAANPP